MPARISASSRCLTLLTVGATLALTTACGSNTAEVPRTVPSAQQTTSATASPSVEPTATPSETGAAPADLVESTDSETTGEQTSAEEAPVEEPAEPEAETQEPAEEEAPAEVPAPDNQLGEGETGARQDTEQTITDTEEQPALANLAEETQQPTGEVQELDDEGSVFYETCEAAAAEGIFNILEGIAGYRIELDEDGNGVACEG